MGDEEKGTRATVESMVPNGKNAAGQRLLHENLVSAELGGSATTR
jgi:hypothetical protein